MKKEKVAPKKNSLGKLKALKLKDAKVQKGGGAVICTPQQILCCQR